MSKAAKSAKTDAPPRRDYDRRKRKGAIRRSSGRPIWRQPLMLGLAVLLLGWAAAAAGGPGSRAGWSRRRTSSMTSSRSVIAVITPFKLTDVTVEGRDYVERDAILAALNVQSGDSLLGIDLQGARKRLEAIDWVASATVERRLPDTLYVTLKERRAVAIWQNGSEYTLIDKNGRTVRASRMPPGADKLLLLGGPGAPEHVGELLLLLAYEPAIAKRAARRRLGRPAPLESGARTTTPRSGCPKKMRSRPSSAWPNSTHRINCCRASSASSICGCRTSSISGSERRPATLRRTDPSRNVAYKHGDTSWRRQEMG